MKVLGDTILIAPEVEEEETVTSSGIYVPEEKKLAPNNRGTIIAVGPDVKELSEGLYIIYSPTHFDEILDNNTEYHVIAEKDVFAILESDTDSCA